MKKILLNECKCRFSACSENESLARTIAVSFVSQASPTISQLADVKCAVSEAVTNSIVHGYADNPAGVIEMDFRRYDENFVTITIRDKGVGIPDIDAARQPLFTTDVTGERSGMGFAIMESLMDKVQVRSTVGKGTTVTLSIKLGVPT
ncbi:MAG: anti-sigma F factor [Clostridia bacterium]|nr:anti-sigma F factor [Clostridia bacterium]